MKELSDGRMSQLLLNRRRVNAVGKDVSRNGLVENL